VPSISDEEQEDGTVRSSVVPMAPQKSSFNLLYCRLFLLILAVIGVGCDFWVLAVTKGEGVIGWRRLKVVLRGKSRVYTVLVGRGKYLFLSAVLFHWKANSFHL